MLFLVAPAVDRPTPCDWKPAQLCGRNQRATPRLPREGTAAIYRPLSLFRQITTSLKRLLGFIRTVLDRTGAPDLLDALLRSVGGTGSALAGLT